MADKDIQKFIKIRKPNEKTIFIPINKRMQKELLRRIKQEYFK